MIEASYLGQTSSPSMTAKSNHSASISAHSFAIYASAFSTISSPMLAYGVINSSSSFPSTELSKFQHFRLHPTL